MQTLRTSIDVDRVLTIWIDAPDKPVNTIGPVALAEFDDVIAAAERDKPIGIIIASVKAKSFVAGADLFEIQKMDRGQIEHFLAVGQGLYDRIAALPMPTIAAINGDCLGGGLELALACTYRVASDVPSISIGLPEVKLGIVPAWGGTLRLPRRIGLARALPLMLAGKTLSPRKAQRIGLIDEVVRPEALLIAAKRIVTSRRRKAKPSLANRLAARLSPARNRILALARQKTLEQTRGNYPAPIMLIDVVRAGYEQGASAALAAERKALTDLVETDACRGLMRLFFLRQRAKKWIAQEMPAKPRPIKYAAVIGGGTMGAGIIHALVKAGIQTRLIEVDAKAAAAAMTRVQKMLKEDVGAGRMTALNARHALNHVAPATDWSGLGLADLVVEAVVENTDAKRQIFAKLDDLARPDAVLATNTSSLSVTEMAQGTRYPQRIVGLHFFNPVPKMPLVEVIRAAQSDEASLATVAALAAKIGKTPVLVKDAPGFLVNRVLIPYLAEALVAATEGTPITTIDAAMKDWGMPMGPFELLDEIGLDVSAHVLRSLARQTGDTRPLPPALDKALERGWLGKKSGRGFYIHDHAKKGAAAMPPNQELTAMLSSAPAVVPEPPMPKDSAQAQAIQWRLVLPMVNEAARLLEEGIVSSADAIDLAMVLGTGLAPFRGGLTRFADTTGIDQIVARMNELAAQHGPRFAPAALLRRLAEEHRMLSEFQEFDRSNIAPPVHQET